MDPDDDRESWSDARETVEADDLSPTTNETPEPAHMSEDRDVDADQEDVTIMGDKVGPHQQKDVERVHTPLSELTESRRPSDAASVQSVPAVHVTEPTTPITESASPTSVPAQAPPPSPSRSHVSAATQDTDRAARRRSIVDSRSSNRFSGFLSNIMHRRDGVTNPASRNRPRQSRTVEGSTLDSRVSGSRPTTPTAMRSTTPPPALPPPSLKDLGLSLRSITSDLSPAHFSTPPTNGAFLAPHYLLLCHAQGLDVLPLTYPPTPQPYALIRRVSFKSVVVMEHRGVLVAIAGRRDGVRVYALDEVKKAIEWRMDVEIRREAERKRREEAKRATLVARNEQLAAEKSGALANQRPTKPRSSSISGPEKASRAKLSRKASASSASTIPVPPTPRPPTQPRRPKTPPARLRSQTPPPRLPSHSLPPIPPVPSDPPPAYQTSPPPPSGPSTLRPPGAVVFSRRRTSVSEVMQGPPRRASGEAERPDNRDEKSGDWADGRHSSDDEAIDLVAAPSGSQLLDERTSAQAQGQGSPASPPRDPVSTIQLTPREPTTSSIRRNNRPANLDLSVTRMNSIPPPQPSPSPTLMTLRQALAQSPPVTMRGASTMNSLAAQMGGDEGPGTPDAEGDEDDDQAAPVGGERISLAQALFESRRPDLPPAGTRRPQQPILIGSHTVAPPDEDPPASPRSSDAHSFQTRRSVGGTSTAAARRRRRWSVLDGIFSGPSNNAQPPVAPAAETRSDAVPSATRPQSPEMTQVPDTSTNGLRRYMSHTNPTPVSANSLEAAQTRVFASSSAEALPLPPAPAIPTASSSSSHSRITRFLNSALHPRREDNAAAAALRSHADKNSVIAPQHTAPAPKLEYVKLPGTKGSVLIKAVETAKKSFLAILCGDNGEKVELFAGTYRTALGLSRTFILPDSPRSLELQLQGDDLVEVFLVFSQNVFGLEPATVRVREVRIGRAERRAARRRARENRTNDTDADPAAPGEDETADTGVNVTIGVAVESPSPSGDDVLVADAVPSSGPPASMRPPETPTEGAPGDGTTTPNNGSTLASEELLALATAQMGPFTTFQQLSFAPQFPLAAIADDYIIPPTYPAFLNYKRSHEPDAVEGPSADGILDNGLRDHSSPPGLPVPAPEAPLKWFYRDPTGKVHGPWKSTLMQSWYKDGMLPPDLPVRPESQEEYILLKDLRLQSVDPSHPFRTPPPPLNVALPTVENAKPLLAPISLLAQPRHFGPPALFYSSRGGHSTTIVDARGRSVIKGRFRWSDDEEDTFTIGRLGDVRRLEAFDLRERSVLVAMRHGGLEAVDLADALLKPADDSRPVLPQFNPPDASTNRRRPFVWRIGTPLASASGGAAPVASRPRSAPATQGNRRASMMPGRSPGKSDFGAGLDPEHDHGLTEEVFFIGRREDDVYLCERKAGSFRVLRLGPDAA